MIAVLLILFTFGYCCGSIPFGLILTKLAGLGDIRAIGSGNIGATNVLRTGNKKLAALVLLLDGLKGAIPIIMVAQQLPANQDLSEIPASTGALIQLVVAAGALIGHIFPIWLKFKGGKGVATGLGVMLGLAWPVGLAACALWLLLAFSLRYSSLSALTAFALSPLLALFLAPDFAFLPLFLGAAALLIFWRHKANIERLLKGTEPKIGSQQ
ncbi:MAG: glycerol-3-phosphate 1-O-acyltransferase PlsY [Alphaproteobacteria bacterium]